MLSQKHCTRMNMLVPSREKKFEPNIPRLPGLAQERSYHKEYVRCSLETIFLHKFLVNLIHKNCHTSHQENILSLFATSKDEKSQSMVEREIECYDTIKDIFKPFTMDGAPQETTEAANSQEKLIIVLDLDS